MNDSIIKQEHDIIRTFEDMRNVSKIFIQSGLFADTKTEAAAIVKIMAGREIGMSPFASMSGIDIIRDKVVIKPILLAAKMKMSNKYNYTTLRHSDSECTIEFTESGKPIGRTTFTITDAKRQGLANKDNYVKQPKVMLFWRALAMGIRQFCPDLYGQAIYLRDEVADDTDSIPEEMQITTEEAPVALTPRLPEPVEEVQHDAPRQLTVIEKKNLVTAAKAVGVSKDDLITALKATYGEPDKITAEQYPEVMLSIKDLSIFANAEPADPPPPDPKDLFADGQEEPQLYGDD